MLRLTERCAYASTELLQTESIDDILAELLPRCRSYYDTEGMDNPQYIIEYLHEVPLFRQELVLDCDIDFNTLDTDEKVIDSLKEWYTDVYHFVKANLKFAEPYGMGCKSLAEQLYEEGEVK